MTDAIFPLFGLDGNNGFVINGIDASDSSGFSISSAGDINADGIDDLIIGAYRADPNGNTDAGESYVVFGNDTGFNSSLNLSSLDGTNGFVINGIDASDRSGSVSGAGDVNGDGIDDLIIGAYRADPNGNTDAGESYVVFGSDTGFNSSLNLSSLDGTNGFVINGIDSNDRSGRSVSGAGDVNDDGINDLIISTYYDGVDGESYVVFGSADPFNSSLNLSSLNGSNGFIINGIDGGDSSPSFAVSSAGDINGDNIDDLIIGVSSLRNTREKTYVVFGNSSGFSNTLDVSTLDGTNGFVINGATNNDDTGYSVSSAGDVNGDGIDDLIIGAPRADLVGFSGSEGESYVVFGNNAGFSGTLNLSSLDGSNGFVISGIDAGDFSGRSVSGAGDVNGDGIDDIIIGARFADPNDEASAGESYIVFGSNSGFNSSLSLSSLDGSNGFILNGIDAGDFLGSSVSDAGDINGDGIDDIIIGADGSDPNGNTDSGESYVIFGSNTGFAPMVGESIADRFGTAGNLYEWKLDDNVFRDPDGDTLTYSATLADDSPLPSWLTFDPNTATFSSNPLSSNTGVVNIKVTATDTSSNSTSTNFALTITDTFFPSVVQLEDLANNTNGFVLNGIYSVDYFGKSVSGAGDVNGDGIDDLIIGADYADPNRTRTGESYVIFGSNSLNGTVNSPNTELFLC